MKVLDRLFGKKDPAKEHAKGAARDAAMLARFRELGTDMARVRPVDHNFVLRSEASARSLAERLSGEASEVRVNHAMGRWNVEAVVPMPLTEAAVAERRTAFEALAAEVGASYDGWGAEADNAPA